MPSDIRMPDGTIIRNVPDGTPRAEIERKWKIAASQKNPQRTAPQSAVAGAGHGLTFGFLDELGAVADTIGLPSGEKRPTIWNGSSFGDAWRANQRRNNEILKDAEKQNPKSYMAGEVAGMIAPALITGGGSTAASGGRLAARVPRLARAARAVAPAVAQGAAYGAGSTNGGLGARARGAAEGAAWGLGGDLAGRAVGKVAERIGRTAPVRRLAERGAQAVSKATGRNVRPLPAPLTRPERTLSQALPDDMAVVRQNVDDATSLGLPFSLADADPKLRQLGGSVARFSPDGRALAEANYGARADDRSFRAIQGVRDYLHPPTDVKQVSDDILQYAQRKAGPFYEDALEGGSMAPLETQFNNAFNQTSKEVSEAAAELAAAQRGATVTSAQVSRAGNNVYGNARALPADRSAQSAITAAERKLAAAQANHQQVLSVLRRTQEDAATDAPGAVWSPRIQQFLDDPIAKGGLSRGLEIQRLEALAQGKPFNPTEYAITGLDETGQPIVGNVPNMRTLDSIKKGLDAIIDEYPKDFKGKPILDERGRAVQQVLKSYRNEVDAINPEYGMARSVYQDAIKPRDALNRGFQSTGPQVPARDLEKITSGMGSKELAQFRAGYATSLTDQIANASDGTNPYNLVAKGINRPAKLQQLYPDGYDQFARMRGLEDEMAKTMTETLGGSQTQPRGVQDQMFQAGIGSDMADAGIQMLSGGGLPGATRMLGSAARYVKDRSSLGLLGAKRKADALAPSLFDTNAQSVQQLLEELSRRQMEQQLRRDAYRRSLGLLGGPGAVIGASGSQ